MKKTFISLLVWSMCVAPAYAEDQCEYCDKTDCPKFLVRHLSITERIHVSCDSTSDWVRNGGIININIYDKHVVTSTKSVAPKKKPKSVKQNTPTINKHTTIVIQNNNYIYKSPRHLYSKRYLRAYKYNRHRNIRHRRTRIKCARRH